MIDDGTDAANRVLRPTETYRCAIYVRLEQLAASDARRELGGSSRAGTGRRQRRGTLSRNRGLDRGTIGGRIANDREAWGALS
jgi:hypothetical protein